ncbi:MAG: DUF3786 domain-containing protein [Desulfobacteraceae bacterium]|nr:DUF3786 domain-containing protein [Desulfobacteraceae bacterium]MBC2749112.1 DUF3786 domain-containing protein [Desulfobacteraceae bacterium]
MTENHPEDTQTSYASDGSHLRQTDRQWQDLAGRSLEELANLTLALPLPGSRLQFSFLNEDIHVDIPNQRLLHIHDGNDIPLEDPLLELVTLTYLNRVDAILPLDRDIVGLQDLKESHFFAGPHELQTDPVLERFSKDPDAFRQAVASLDGRLTDMADAAGRLLPFPRIPLYFLMWFEDEEFPARLRVLFDRPIERFLPADAIWALVNRVARALVDETGIGK